MGENGNSKKWEWGKWEYGNIGMGENGNGGKWKWRKIKMEKIKLGFQRKLITFRRNVRFVENHCHDLENQMCLQKFKAM